MWLYGYRLGFVGATVIQKRNPHDYFKDSLDEIPMYQQVEKIIGIVQSVLSPEAAIETNLYKSYEALHAAFIVKPEELNCLESRLTDLEDITISG
jgi:hypothetical protein